VGRGLSLIAVVVILVVGAVIAAVGTVGVINAQRLGEIVLTLHAEHLAVKRLRMVQPCTDKAPNLMLIEAVKGAALTGMRHEPALIVRDVGGNYTEEIRAIYGQDI